MTTPNPRHAVTYAVEAELIALRAVVARLPRCHHPECGTPATRRYSQPFGPATPLTCDDPAHSVDAVDYKDLPFAYALRFLTRTLAGDLCRCARCDLSREVVSAEHHLSAVEKYEALGEAGLVPARVNAHNRYARLTAALEAAPPCPNGLFCQEAVR